MKQFLPFVLLAAMLAGCTVTTSTSTSSGDEKPATESGDKAPATPGYSDIVLSDKENVKENVDSDAANTEQIFVYYSFNAKTGDKLTGTLYIDKTDDEKLVGKVKSADVVIPEGAVNTGNFNFTKPADRDWPVGEYHVDLALNDEVLETVEFSVTK